MVSNGIEWYCLVHLMSWHCKGLHCNAQHPIVLHIIVWYWIVLHWLDKKWLNWMTLHVVAIKWYCIVLICIPCIALYVIECYCIVQQSLREHSRYVPRSALVFEATFRNIQLKNLINWNQWNNYPLMQAILGFT